MLNTMVILDFSKLCSSFPQLYVKKIVLLHISTVMTPKIYFALNNYHITYVYHRYNLDHIHEFLEIYFLH